MFHILSLSFANTMDQMKNNGVRTPFTDISNTIGGPSHGWQPGIDLPEIIAGNQQCMINEEVRVAAPSSLTDIKEFTSAVSVDIGSIFPQSDFFTMYQTNLFQTLQTGGLSVFVYTLMNEFASQPYDFSDSTAQINAYFKVLEWMANHGFPYSSSKIQALP
ncbi:hypothetical protein U9M48_039322 [Paspalum notatum var. saurae]|uniref:glycerophosphodiester phosphodiesterase n=1 Tax=Paspalum notatum var. saurae TaxID=547442 RepID=A0AAQ3UNC7_PASNO